MPRFSAVVLVVMAVFAFSFIAHEPSSGPTLQSHPRQDLRTHRRGQRL